VIAIDSLAYAIAPAAQPVAAGCNATGTDAAAGGLLALLALVLLGARRPAKVRVPAAPSRRR
jgi:MYXO-CTERM domain-containing protein